MATPSSDIDEIIQLLIKFRDDRDWRQFHNSKDLAIAINVEASELLELFLWKKSDEVDKVKVKEELADVLAYCLLMAHDENFNVAEIIADKFRQNATKYPIEKSRGTSKKYDEL